MRSPKQKELSNSDYNRIEQLSEDGNALFEQEKMRLALRKYESALEIVPDPNSHWEAATWLYTSIGDCYFSLGELEEAKANYYNAMNCPDGASNPYINFSLGQVLFDLEEMEKSQQSLLRAYMVEGDEIFEDEDPKYRRSIQHIIDNEENNHIKSDKPKREYIYENFTRYYKDEEGNLIEDN